MSDKNRVTSHLLKAENDLAEATILLEANYPDGTCNRAFYAWFDCLLALLYATDGPISKTHTGAHTEFRKQFILTGYFKRMYSDTITELFNLRQGGDYEIDFDISLEDAQEAVEKAPEFLSITKAYLHENDLAS